MFQYVGIVFNCYCIIRYHFDSICIGRILQWAPFIGFFELSQWCLKFELGHFISEITHYGTINHLLRNKIHVNLLSKLSLTVNAAIPFKAQILGHSSQLLEAFSYYVKNPC
uniref:(northern house mosquito) hypothetical protein n=1 Tax=Culex pipiens TaxID=7175 RepID=A0A8D8IUB8_CULPI